MLAHIFLEWSKQSTKKKKKNINESQLKFHVAAIRSFIYKIILKISENYQGFSR